MDDLTKCKKGDILFDRNNKRYVYLEQVNCIYPHIIQLEEDFIKKTGLGFGARLDNGGFNRFGPESPKDIVKIEQ